MSIEDTGGGAHVGGNVDAGRDFTGRDSTENSHGNQFNFRLGNGNSDSYRSQQRREHLSIEDRIRDMERYLYGDERAGEPGLIMRTRTQLRWSQANTVLLAIILMTLISMLKG